jgi:hypothetical protein
MHKQFGSGENRKIDSFPLKKRSCRGSEYARPAFPQFRRRLALVTLFPLPLRPEKQV